MAQLFHPLILLQSTVGHNTIVNHEQTYLTVGLCEAYMHRHMRTLTSAQTAGRCPFTGSGFCVLNTLVGLIEYPAEERFCSPLTPRQEKREWKKQLIWQTRLVWAEGESILYKYPSRKWDNILPRDDQTDTQAQSSDVEGNERTLSTFLTNKNIQFENQKNKSIAANLYQKTTN